MSSHLAPGDEGWRAEKALVADLATLNTEVGRYVLRQLDADAGRAEASSVQDEQALADRLTSLGELMQARVERRVALGELAAAVEGEAGKPAALDPNPDMDNGP